MAERKNTRIVSMINGIVATMDMMEGTIDLDTCLGILGQWQGLLTASTIVYLE